MANVGTENIAAQLYVAGSAASVVDRRPAGCRLSSVPRSTRCGRPSGHFAHRQWLVLCDLLCSATARSRAVAGGQKPTRCPRKSQPWPTELWTNPVTDPKILNGGGGRQFISSVLIYRKCTQRSVGPLHGKGGSLEKNRANRGRPPPPPHLNPPLCWKIKRTFEKDCIQWRWVHSCIVHSWSA